MNIRHLFILLPIFISGCATEVRHLTLAERNSMAMRAWQSTSGPLNLQLPNGASFKGKKYASGLIEGTYSSPEFSYSSGQWQGDISLGNAKEGELKIQIPGGVIVTTAELKNFRPVWNDYGGSLVLPSNIVISAKEYTEKASVTYGPRGYHDKVQLHDGSGASVPFKGGLETWIRLCKLMRENADKKINHFIGVTGEGGFATVTVDYKNKASKSSTYRTYFRWGMEPSAHSLWRLSVSNDGIEGDKIPDSLTTRGTVIELLPSGYYVKGGVKNGVIDGPVLLTHPTNPGVIEGQFSNGQILGALKEYSLQGGLSALILPIGKTDWLRLDIGQNSTSCKILGLPKEAQKEWLVPPGLCNPAGLLQGELKSAITRDHSYALLNIKADSGHLYAGSLTALNTQVDQYAEGGFNKGIFSGALWNGGTRVQPTDSVEQRLIYQGPFIDGLAEGEGLCGYNKTFEPCAYSKGNRVDPLHYARELSMAEARRVQACELAWLQLPGAGSNFMRSVDPKRCDGEWEELKKLTESAIRQGVKFFHPSHTALDVSIHSVESCYDNYFVKVGSSAKASLDDLEQRMRKNECYDEGAVAVERRALNENIRELNKIAQNGISALGPARQMERQGRAAARTALANEQRQLAADIVSSVRNSWNSTYSFLASVQQSTQQIMANNARTSSYGTQTAKAKEVLADTKSRATKDPVFKQKKEDLTKLIQERCAKVGARPVLINGEWHCNPENKTVYIPWNPARLCYDPTGKVCNTGEVHGKKANDSNESGSSGSGVNEDNISNSGKDNSTSESKSKSNEMETRPEAMSYVWKTNNGRWLCQSPSSKLYVSVATSEEAEKLCVCSGFRSRQPANDGYAYFCNRPLESFDSNVYEIYTLYSMAGVRKSYNCPKEGITVQCMSH